MKATADPTRLDGMARYGIATDKALGITVVELRALARQIGRAHDLATALWETEIHEARILASMLDVPAEVTEAQMEAWVLGFDSWDLCDQVCSNLFDRTPHALRKAVEWSAREEEFVKRAGFALIACITVHRKDLKDRELEALLPVIRAASTDERNYVKKAVNWALRQIGKHSAELNAAAVATAESIREQDSKVARWIAADALRELTSAPVRKRLGL